MFNVFGAQTMGICRGRGKERQTDKEKRRKINGRGNELHRKLEMKHREIETLRDINIER